MRGARLICNVVTSAIVLWTLATALLVSVGCSAEGLSPKMSSQICSGIETRYLVVVATDAITDSILALLPAFLCRNLQMRLEFKLQVLGVFALRLPLVPLAALFFKSWKVSLHSSNPGVARTAPLIYQQIQLCYSLIASTIPCLRSFLQSFDTGSGFKAGFGSSSNGYPYAWRSGGRQINTVHTDKSETYEMNAYLPSRKCTSSARNETYGENSIVNRTSFNTNGGLPTTDNGVDSKRRSTQESDRRSHQSTQELFIRKDVKWEVSRERVRRGSDVNSPGMLRIAA
ncbi:hypothetical protein J1614_008172 [Plenodomus biglobosus]|nr:hypothetical protein J1614_008172 [Plenodomus biglobosus]